MFQKGFANVLVLLVLLALLPVGFFLAQHPQIFKPKAYGGIKSSDKSPTQANLNPNVYILEDDGTVASEDGIVFYRLTQLFYKKHPDKYDFIAIFPAFKPGNNLPGFSGLHSLVQNNVRGICLPIQQIDSALWGSKKLQSVEQYPFKEDNYQSWLDNPSEGINILLEETSHHWLTTLGKLHHTLPPGQPPDGTNKSCLESNIPLLAPDDLHWSEGLQSLGEGFGAMRNSKPWLENGDGTYSYDLNLADKPRKFHLFDLYLMGLIDKSEVTDEYLLLSDIQPVIEAITTPPSLPVGPPPSGPPVISNKVSAKVQKVTISDIIQIAGEERSPKIDNSQKDFIIAFVILTKMGQAPSDTLVKAINQVANNFPNKWAYATNNRSTINKNTLVNCKSNKNCPKGYSCKAVSKKDNYKICVSK